MGYKFPRLLVLGHGRHGKDTVARAICKRYSVTGISSSLFVAEKAVRPALARAGIIYDSLQECYDYRHHHRKAWHDAIREYNRPDASRLGRELFAEYDIYCGLRDSAEFHALSNTNAFDMSIWVDASQRLALEDETSISVRPWMADFVIDNNGSLSELTFNIDQFCTHQLDPYLGLVMLEHSHDEEAASLKLAVSGLGDRMATV